MSCVNAVYVVSTDIKPNSRLWHTFCPEMTLLSLASTRNLWSNIRSSKVGLTVDSVSPFISKEESSVCTAVEGCFSQEGSTFNVSVTGMHLDLWVDGTLNTFPSVLCNFLGILSNFGAVKNLSLLQVLVDSRFWDNFAGCRGTSTSREDYPHLLFFAIISISWHLAWFRAQDDLSFLNRILYLRVQEAI